MNATQAGRSREGRAHHRVRTVVPPTRSDGALDAGEGGDQPQGRMETDGPHEAVPPSAGVQGDLADADPLPEREQEEEGRSAEACMPSATGEADLDHDAGLTAADSLRATGGVASHVASLRQKAIGARVQLLKYFSLSL